MNPFNLPDYSVVASRPGGFVADTFSDTGRTCRTEHYAVGGFTMPRVVYHNIATGGEAAPPANNIVVRSSFEYPAGTAVRVTWGGREDANGGITIPPGGYVVSDPIMASIPEGTRFWFNQFVVPSGGTLYPKSGINMPQTATHIDTTLFPATPIESVEVGTTDRTLTLAYAGATASRTATLNGVATYAPLCVLGIPDEDRTVVATFGPSDMSGYNDTLGATAGAEGLDRIVQGWPGAVLDRRTPWFHYGANSQGLASWVNATASATNARKRLLGIGDIAIVQYGLADLVNATYTVAQTKTMMLAFLDVLSDLYDKVYVLTVQTPTTSTDSWATVANQSRYAVANAFGPKSDDVDDFNEWLLTYPHPAITKVIDFGGELSALKADGTTEVKRIGSQSDALGHLTRAGYDMAARLLLGELGRIT